VSPVARGGTFATYQSPHRAVLSDELELAALPTAVGLTRLFVGVYLRKWSLEAVTDIAELVASEIVTNAIKATGLSQQPADYAALHDADVGRVITRLCWLESSLVIETWDGEQRPPVQSSPVDLDEGGRGLMLVTALTTAWGHYPSGNGKVVWAEIAIPTATRTRVRPSPPHCRLR
jgi:Histidine kinase-like ATPase domain